MAIGDLPRTMALKRIYDPNGGSDDYIDVPVIVALTITDQGDGQEYLHQFDSTGQNFTRTVHKHTVKNQTTDNLTGDDSNSIDVERIDAFEMQLADRLVEVTPLNNDPPPLRPYDSPDIGHQKTHVVRYNKDNVNDPGSGPWVDVELIDEILLQGFWIERDRNLEQYPLESRASDDAQQTVLSIANDPGVLLNDSSDPYNPRWSDIHYWDGKSGVESIGYLPEDTNGKTDPVRLDPFQNIVNVSWGGLAVQFFDGAT